MPHIVLGADCDRTYKGKYVWGHEVDSFKPCNSNKSYWVSASSWVKGPLLEYYKKLKLKPYEPIYIEFRGHVLNEAVDGFAVSYDGLIRISEVKTQINEIPETCK